MTRLTKEVRNRILNRAIKRSKFKATAHELIARGNEIAEQVRIESLGGQTVADQLLDISEEMTKKGLKPPLTTEAEIVARYGGHSNTFYFASHSLYGSKNSNPFKWFVEKGDAERRICHYSSHQVKRKLLEKGCFKYSQDCEAFRQELNKTVSELTALLNSVTTVKRLLEVWPEAKEIIPQEVLFPKLQTKELAVQTKELNQALGLPSK